MSVTRLATPLATNQDLDPDRLRQAFGVFPSGVVAVAAQVDGTLTGLAASSFTSVSLEPALVSFSVANTSRTWPTLRRAEHLGLSVLAEHHEDACRRLAGPVEHRFDDLAWSVNDQGAVTTPWCCCGCTASATMSRPRSPARRWCSTTAGSGWGEGRCLPGRPGDQLLGTCCNTRPVAGNDVKQPARARPPTRSSPRRRPRPRRGWSR